MTRLGVGLVLLTLALLSADRRQAWQEGDRTLWAGAVAHSPEKPRPWINLAQQYARLGYDGMAEETFAWASELTQRPGRSRDEREFGWAVSETNRALLLVKRGEIAAAKAVLVPVRARTSYRTPQQVWAWIEQGSPSFSPPDF